MAATRDRNCTPTVEIGGKTVEVSDVSIDPGNHIQIGVYGELCISEARPSITLQRCSISDYLMHQTNHVRLVFPKRKRWAFPDERFVTYEESDESWCRYFGIGREVEYTTVIDMPNAFVEAADYDSVRLVGVIELTNVDVTL